VNRVVRSGSEPAGTSAPAGSVARGSDQLRITLEVALALGLVAIAVLLVTRFVAVPWAVSGISMSPTLEPGDRVIVDLWSYRRRGPRHGEVALFDGPSGLPLVKRISALPPTGAPLTPAIPPLDPDEKRWFVVGDNPGVSEDSRRFGPVPRHRFRGRVVFRYWPPSRAGAIR
jgi:signal peptidase I